MKCGTNRFRSNTNQADAGNISQISHVSQQNSISEDFLAVPSVFWTPFSTASIPIPEANSHFSQYFSQRATVAGAVRSAQVRSRDSFSAVSAVEHRYAARSNASESADASIVV